MEVLTEEDSLTVVNNLAIGNYVRMEIEKYNIEKKLENFANNEEKSMIRDLSEFVLKKLKQNNDSEMDYEYYY